MVTLRWTETINAGIGAYRSYLSKAHNPYGKETIDYSLWDYGWDKAQDKARKNN